MLLAGAGAGMPAAARSVAPAPRAVVRDPPFDFGQVRMGEKIVHSFRVHNAGNAALAFTGAELSMPGMTCRISPSIEPGADGPISIEWSTARVSGRVRGVASIATNDPAMPTLQLEISGRVIGPVDIEPMPAIFLSTFRGEDVRRELTIHSNQAGAVSLRLVGDGSAHLRVSLRTVEEGRTWRLVAQADPKAGPGRYEEELALESDNPAIGRLRIPVHLFVKSDLYANPDEVDFGDVPLARLRRQPAALPFLSQTFLVKKRSGDFRLLRLRSTVPALDLRAEPAGGASGSFEITAGLRADALRPGSLEGTITIETDDPVFPEVTLRVSGRVTD